MATFTKYLNRRSSLEAAPFSPAAHLEKMIKMTAPDTDHFVLTNYADLP